MAVTPKTHTKSLRAQRERFSAAGDRNTINQDWRQKGFVFRGPHDFNPTKYRVRLHDRLVPPVIAKRSTRAVR